VPGKNKPEILDDIGRGMTLGLNAVRNSDLTHFGVSDFYCVGATQGSRPLVMVPSLRPEDVSATWIPRGRRRAATPG
jgi:hypothetical protein